MDETLPPACCCQFIPLAPTHWQKEIGRNKYSIQVRYTSAVVIPFLPEDGSVKISSGFKIRCKLKGLCPESEEIVVQVS